MKLHALDMAIIGAYLVLTLIIGFYISKKAKANLDSYFLGGKTIPWYILGLSNASGMFDITGTMWFVSICFVYGMKSAWLPWIWPVWNQIFLMMFLAQWLRRSNVMTGAEWLKTRFGEGKGAQLSHIIVVVFALVSVIGFIAYGFVGIGKFATSFLPWDLTTQIGSLMISSENMYALLIMGVTTIYVVKGGMYSVVMTEILQFLVMTVSCLIIGIIAINLVTPEQLNAVIPVGWKDIFVGWKLDLDWSNLIPSVGEKIKSDGYEFFSIVMMMMIFKGVLVSIAGPVPSYDMQRILATKSPREAAKMSGIVSLVLYFPRYMMVAGLTILALVYFSPKLNAMGPNIDFEMVLPYAVSNFIPVGLLGLLLAGLIAAFMSTFAANVNAGPAYIVNDIYKRFINPNASNKKYVQLSYISSFAVVAVGITFGFFVTSIDSVTKWIVAALFGGYTAANLLKWTWWRFNGFGYFYGMLAGLVASLVVPLVLPNVSALNSFPIILCFATIGSVGGSLLTKPDDMEVLKKFYSTVRPWGFWKPVCDEVQKDNPDFKPNKDFKRDMFNCVVGIIWQTTLIVMPMYLVIREFTEMIVAAIIFVVTTVILKKTWYDKLED
ncbi:sodium:solute symporter [Puteibacter caeruleilacunae]|nr:sodium:solute symporter [Puteibacter caeruleilacunae]